MFITPLDWIDPIEQARAVCRQYTHVVFLHSALRLDFTGRYSYLAYGLEETITGKHFSDLAKKLTSSSASFDNAWFGYLGYGLKHDTETLPHDEPGFIELPSLQMAKFSHIMVFDHDTKQVMLYHSPKSYDIPHTIPTASPQTITVAALHSNMDKKTYLSHVQTILDAIDKGDLYQANLTRKFYGTLTDTPDHFELFAHLCQISPSPYSAYVRFGDQHIISSSPEQFLSIGADGYIATRPIKGSAPRSDNKQQDQASYDQLCSSEKDKAENLMIVDLMRNDLARTAQTSSVKTVSLFDVTPYATIYQMSSTITAYKRHEHSTLDVIKQSFPPGSMTGAPKIHAITLCSQLEKKARGVYSGAIGWLGGDGSADFSVVIRTLIMNKQRFEFQVGGGIVADSKPINEWLETLVKAKAVAQVLNLQADKDLLF